MNCPKCNAWVPDDSAFCPECGQKIEAPAPEATAAQVFCANCGAAMDPSDSFCENCGAKVESAPAPTKSNPIAGILKTVSGMKYAKLGIAVVAVVLVVAIIVALFSGGNVNNYAMYIKDGELQYAEMPKGKDVTEISSDLASNYSNSTLASYSYLMASYVQMSEDGKKLFFPDKFESLSYYGVDFTLYYWKTGSNKEPEKIDSGVTKYVINTKGSLVNYMKDGNLYQHNLKEKTKIASDVVSFFASKDGKNLIYMTYDDSSASYNLYSKKGNKDAEKIASEVTSIENVSEDLNTVIYMKEGSLYIKDGKKDAEKIASDVTDVYYIYEDGQLYYTKNTEVDESLTYWDLVNDDYQDKDSWTYEDYKDWFSGYTLDMGLSSLYFYNGKDSVCISESVLDIEDNCASEPVVIYTALESTDIPTWSLTKIIDENISRTQLKDMLSDYMEENQICYIAAKEEADELGVEDIARVQLTADGKAAWVFTDYSEEHETVTLNKLTLNGSTVKKSEKMDEDVNPYYIYFVNGDSVVYFKDVSNYEGELYMDGKKLDDDVCIYYCMYNEENSRLYYMVDYNTDKSQGTLKYSNGKKATTVKDDVHQFIFTPDGQVLFLYDYSMNSYKGELWIQNGNKATKLDDDVAAILPVG